MSNYRSRGSKTPEKLKIAHRNINHAFIVESRIRRGSHRSHHKSRGTTMIGRHANPAENACRSMERYAKPAVHACPSVERLTFSAENASQTGVL